MIDARTLLSEIVRIDLPPLDDSEALNTISGLDSLAMVKLVLRIERAIHRELTESELEALVTVGDVARLIATV